MKKIVFISSTCDDLKEERKSVWECLEQFNVTVKGMEQFGARKSDPLTTCLSEVEQSDIYVGIIGMRYGSVDSNSGKSYTQLEYEKAVEKDKDILIYLIDEDNASVRLKHIQYDKINKLNNFKSLLKEKHVIDTFSNTIDLVSKLNRKFSEMLSLKNGIITEDEYENTKITLDLFFLVPSAYSGREIKLKIKFIDSPKPASMDVCKNFNLEFGKTVISKINIIHPQFEFKNFQHIFIEYKLFDEYQSLCKKNEYEIYAKVLFKEDKVKSLTTDFRDRLERVYDFDFDFDPQNYNEVADYQPYYDVLKQGDGHIILILKNIANKIS